MSLTREQIAERLQTKNTWLTGTRTDIFGAVVPERKVRYIVGIWLNGDGVASRTVDIEKLEEDGTTYTMKWQGIPVAPTERVPVPPNWHFDLENPSMTLEGGARLYGKTGAPAGISVNSTTEYWDSDI